jgi:hypothetical protein
MPDKVSGGDGGDSGDSRLAPRVVTLSRAGGKPLGLSLSANPASGTGLVVLAITPGSDADTCGQIFVNDLVASLNGINVQNMLPAEITKMIGLTEEPVFTFIASGGSAPTVAQGGRGGGGAGGTPQIITPGSRRRSLSSPKEPNLVVRKRSGSTPVHHF